MILSVVQPASLYALTSGPSQPEFNSFTPIGTSDMVNLSSGDFNYNIPIMDVGGYPLNLAYDSGVTMDQEATWVGLGWNLNVGQINRQVRGLPDDFKGDEMIYRDHIRDNKTVGLTLNVNPQFVGLGDVGLTASAGITMQHNNYTGISFEPSYGISYSITKNLSVGMNISSSASSGATVNPSVSISRKSDDKSKSDNNLSSSVGVSYNSRKGLTSFNMSASASIGEKAEKNKYQNKFSTSGQGSISFVNNTYTPPNRKKYDNSNISFAISFGPDLWGIDAEIGVTGFGAIQKLKDTISFVNAYGYNFNHLGDHDSMLDFNREKEDIISKKTLVLPITNYTFDIYNINGQGTGGMFRPFRSQVGLVYSQTVQDDSNSDSFGGEIEGGTGWHVGLDFRTIDGESRTGIWDTPVTNYFEYNEDDDTKNIDFEEVYYKAIGEFNIDNESAIFNTQLGGNNPIRIGISGTQNSPGKYALNSYFKKEPIIPNDGLGGSGYSEISFNQPIAREHRELRNKAIVPVSFQEASLDPLFDALNTNPNARGHHLAGYKTINADGARYIYGETVYNTQKLESTFAVEEEGPDNVKKGTITYSDTENSTDNSSGMDEYFSSIETPAYAHTFLLSSVLSADYEDLTGDGPTDDDLGAYTRFNYKQTTDQYRWRIPYYKVVNEDTDKKASYNHGLNSNTEDQKGSIVEGEKELKYIETIETKTHVAYFRLADREDAKEFDGEDHMQNITHILLYSKPEYQKLVDANTNFETADIDLLSETAIKVAYFNYEYLLCKNIPNHSVYNSSTQTGPGKLTLTSLYFTYGDSFMGRHTPYTFEYHEDYTANGNTVPFNYSLKGYDVWGNYKPNEANSYEVDGVNNPLSPQEFPFVQQEDKDLQDQFASAWSLSTIKLPSGGKIDIDYETDDYQYVQDEKAMRMFKVVGVTNEDQGPPDETHIGHTNLFNNGNYDQDAKYLIVQIPETGLLTGEEFREKYIGDHFEKPIYFRFMLNMSKDGYNGVTPNDFDYVTGYFKIDPNPELQIEETFVDGEGNWYGAIPMDFSDMEGGVSTNEDINPISKAGWYFGRKNLPRKVYGLPLYTDGSVGQVMRQLEEDFGSFDEMIIGPNAKLRNQKLIARKFVPEKSWIRLLEPNDRKLGGGVRVKKIEMHDQWDQMQNPNDTAFNQYYGQEYTYSHEDGSTTGVATYEPNSSKENPFVEPFYNGDESLVAPRELNYVEKPFGESFFPSPVVTYSKVEVKNLSRSKIVGDDTVTLKKHATGKVVNEFYTSKNFPTISDYTDLDSPENWYSNDDNIIGQTLGSLIGLEIDITTELTLSQGFVVQTNDMNGRQKKQSVYNEVGDYLSGVEYKYSIDEQEGTLNNNVVTIDKNGTVSSVQEIGMHYEVINDFKENYSYSKTFGMQGNVAVLPFGPFIVVIPMMVPESSVHTNILHTVTTTKVINRTGILIEKIAYDLGASVSTKNLAWDAESGEVLLTEVDNEYNEPYYNFNYPAYWANKGMGLASNNIGISGFLTPSSDKFYTLSGGNFTNIEDVFIEGDELQCLNLTNLSFNKYWVTKLNNTGVSLMDREGEILNLCNLDATATFYFKIVRSGYRNLQTAAMASVTSKLNPIIVIDENEGIYEDFDPHFFDYNSTDTPHVLNASAVLYKQFWKPQIESGLPVFPATGIDDEGNPIVANQSIGFNPYVYNVKSKWKAESSFAYLTGRDNIEISEVSTRNDGYYDKFESFYIQNAGNWEDTYPSADSNYAWEFASLVSKQSPYGAELENKDALNRYSAAQYAYNYTLPVAVASNSEYRQMGMDSFEDYDYIAQNTDPSLPSNPHFSFYDVAKDNGGIDSGTIMRSAITSHTGKYSLAIAANESAVLQKSLTPCRLKPVDCPEEDPLCPDPECEYPDCGCNDGGEITIIVLEDCTCNIQVEDEQQNGGEYCVGECHRSYRLTFENIPDNMTAEINFSWELDIDMPPQVWYEYLTSSFTLTGYGTETLNYDGSNPTNTGAFSVIVSNTDEITINLNTTGKARCTETQMSSTVTLEEAIILQTQDPLTIANNIFSLNSWFDTGVPCN